MGAPWEKYQTKSAEPKGPWSKYGTGTSPAEPPKQVNYQDATDDPTWIKNARTIYKEVNKADPKDDYEATTFLKDYLYDFNYRLAGSDKVGLRNTFGVANDVGSFSPEGKQAFLDAQQQFENFDITLPGVLQAGERVLTDPTTYLGLGVGKLVGQGVKTAAKQGVEELAKVGIKQGIARGATVGAAEGGAYAGAGDFGQQMAQVNAGGQAYIDPTQVATSAGFGAMAGAGLGGAAGAVGGLMARRNPSVQAARRIVEDPEKAVRSAEITTKLADVQSTRDVPMGLADVNQVVDLEQGRILENLKNLGLPKERYNSLARSLKKSRGISPDELADLRSTPEGAAIADNIEAFKQYRDMVAPRASEGGVRRAIRVGIDFAPIPRVVGDALKYAFLKPRITGEEQIANVVSPGNLKIAEEILRLKGPSKATAGRQWLLDQGLKMAKARQDLRAQQAALNAKSKADFELRRETRKAEVAKRRADAEQARLKRVEEAQKKREELQRQRELNDRIRTNTGLGRQYNAEMARQQRAAEQALRQNVRTNTALGKQQAREAEQTFRQNVRTNTGLGRQQNAEEAKAAREQTKGFEEALSRVNAKMAMEQKLNRQRLSELRSTEKAIAEAQASVSVAKAKEGQAFDQALRKTTAKMKSLAALEKFKQRELARQAKSVASGEDFKSVRSRKFTKKDSPNTDAPKETPQGAEASRSQGPGVYNPIAYQAGADTIVDFQRRALDAAARQPDKKLGQLLKRAVEDMVLAKNNQQKRQEAYDKAADAAAEMGADALEFIDQNLYFLVMKYAN